MNDHAPQSSRTVTTRLGPPPELPLAWPALSADTGLWAGLKQLPSPHCDARPEAELPSAVILHNISLPPSVYGGGYIDQLFLGQLQAADHPYFEGIVHLKVSAHACVFRDGSATQYVPTHLRAWHAGASVLDGRERCNDFSIGIELEGSDYEPFTDAQYQTVARLVAEARRCYPAIRLDRIRGHEDVAPGRKTDPGPYFDWTRFFALLEHPR